MAYLSEEELEKMNFKFLGKNVKISGRASIYNCEEIEIGDNSRIDDFCVLSGKIKIGRNVHITAQCLVAGGVKGIIMDDFSGLAYQVQVFTQSDDYSGRTMTNPTVPSEFKKEIKKEIYIGKHVLIAAGSIILPGVKISTKPWGIYMGNPAKRIMERRKDLLELEKKYLESEKMR